MLRKCLLCVKFCAPLRWSSQIVGLTGTGSCISLLWPRLLPWKQNIRNLSPSYSPSSMTSQAPGWPLNFVEDAFSVLSDPAKRAAFDSKRNDIGNNFYDLDFKVWRGDGLKSGNETAIKRDVARCCSDEPGFSRTKRAAYVACVGIGSMRHVAEDYADEKQKKIGAEEASCITAKMRSKEANDLHSKLEEGSCYSSLHLVAKKRYHSDFYDFENNRKAELFSTGQVLVAYDQENMPRRYGQIDKVIPDKSQLHVTWFRHCPQTLQQKRLCDVGFPVACESFALELSKITVSQPIVFSHLLSNGIERQSIEVHPEKGEIWAVYRGWDMEWCLNMGIGQKSGFEMVQILTVLKDTGVKVACLVKVYGHKSVFQRYSKRGMFATDATKTSSMSTTL